MRQEDFLKRVKEGTELDVEDKIKLRELSNSPLFQKLLTVILKDADSRAELLLNCDLGTPQGIRNASVLQGEARGLTFAVLTITELVAEPDETQEKEPDGKRT